MYPNFKNLMLTCSRDTFYFYYHKRMTGELIKINNVSVLFLKILVYISIDRIS